MAQNPTGDPLRESAVAAYVKLIRTAEALHTEVSRHLAPHGLTASQFSTLKVLRLHGPLAQKDIASYLLRTGGNITVVVDNLQKQGLVRRLRDKADRRLVMVSLTPTGQSLFDELYSPHLERIERAMGALSEPELRNLLETLERLHTTTVEPLCSQEPMQQASMEAS